MRPFWHDSENDFEDFHAHIHYAGKVNPNEYAEYTCCCPMLCEALWSGNFPCGNCHETWHRRH